VVGILRGANRTFIDYHHIIFTYDDIHIDLSFDAGAMRAMYKARTQQRSRLLTELAPSKMSQLKAS